MAAFRSSELPLRVEAVRKRKIGVNTSCRRAAEGLGSPPLRYARLPSVIEFVAVCSDDARQTRLATRSARLIVR
jgi:hypothetical protein